MVLDLQTKRQTALLKDEVGIMHGGNGLNMQINSPGGQMRVSCPGYHQLGAPHEHVQDDEHPKSDLCFPPQCMVAYWHLMPTRHTQLEEFHPPPEIRSA